MPTGSGWRWRRCLNRSRRRGKSWCVSGMSAFAVRSWNASSNAPRRKPPLIMGHEFAGTVVALGEGVTNLTIGQKVAVNPFVVCHTCQWCRMGKSNICERRQLMSMHRPGAFAEFVAAPAENCHPLPDSADTQGSHFRSCQDKPCLVVSKISNSWLALQLTATVRSGMAAQAPSRRLLGGGGGWLGGLPHGTALGGNREPFGLGNFLQGTDNPPGSATDLGNVGSDDPPQDIITLFVPTKKKVRCLCLARPKTSTSNISFHRLDVLT